MITEHYTPISLEDLQNNIALEKTGILFTFDDGLTDHYTAAKILHEHNIQGIFFIPTAPLIDHIPANPQIIHYILAHHNIQTFLDAYEEVRKEEGIEHEIPHTDNETPLQTIKNIKKTFKYTLTHTEGRTILTKLYERLLATYIPSILSDIHLTHEQIQDMVSMGHAIGVHSHSHPSVGAKDLDEQTFAAEMIAPQQYLSETFTTEVNTLSYPFGGKKDCLSSEALLRKTSLYDFAFTVEPVVNDTEHSDPLTLGRCEPWPDHDAPKLRAMFESLEDPTI